MSSALLTFHIAVAKKDVSRGKTPRTRSKIFPETLIFGKIADVIYNSGAYFGGTEKHVYDRAEVKLREQPQPNNRFVV